MTKGAKLILLGKLKKLSLNSLITLYKKHVKEPLPKGEELDVHKLVLKKVYEALVSITRSKRKTKLKKKVKTLGRIGKSKRKSKYNKDDKLGELEITDPWLDLQTKKVKLQADKVANEKLKINQGPILRNRQGSTIYREVPFRGQINRNSELDLIKTVRELNKEIMDIRNKLVDVKNEESKSKKKLVEFKDESKKS